MIIRLLKKHFLILCKYLVEHGRADKKGRVYIQTALTDNYILDSVVNNDYVGFYEKEIEFRKRCGYPPFIDIFLFEFISQDLNVLRKDADFMYQILSDDKSNVYKVFSPKSPLIQKINNKYRINILLKSKASNQLYKLLYQKIELYDKKRNKKVKMTVTKNPLFIN